MIVVLKKSFSKIISLLTSVSVLLAMTTFPINYSKAEQLPESQLKDMAIEIAYLVNELRSENGLSPVYVVPYLCDASKIRAQECVTTFGHDRPDGSKFSTAIDYNIVPYDVLLENIAAGFSSPKDTMLQWENSEKHLQNMLNPKITHMGVAVAYDENSDYQWYWEEIFVITTAHFDDEYIPSKYDITPQAEGDLTGDAVVDTYDYIMLADYIYKKRINVPVYLNDAQLATADCFRDGVISEADAKVLVRYILGEYDTIPYIF